MIKCFLLAMLGIPTDGGQPMPKRMRRQNSMLNDFCVMSTTGQKGVEVEGNPNGLLAKDQLRLLYYSILDNVAGELKQRFIDVGAGLAKGVSALLPASTKFLSPDDLHPLSSLLQQDREDDVRSALTGELIVAKNFVRDKLPADSDLQGVAKVVLPFKEAFPMLYWHYAAALTLGISTASCENSFSCLTRVLRPNRLSMTHLRKNNLVVLAFEKRLTQSLCMDDFVQKFSQRSRRISL